MRQSFPYAPCVPVFVILSTSFGSAADVYWANTAGGNWNQAANWSPSTRYGP
jgi:hypothetical protein